MYIDGKQKIQNIGILKTKMQIIICINRQIFQS